MTIMIKWRSNRLILCRYYKEYKLPFPDSLDKWWYLKSSMFVCLVGGWGKTLLDFGNNIKFYNQETLYKYVNKRGRDTPLLTVANHSSMLDDPCIIASMQGYDFLPKSRQMRWSLAAKEICFSNRLFSYISSHGKVIPIVRGDGIYQPAIDFAIDQLNKGEWVHIFPEGQVTLEPVRLKWGVGRMIAESYTTPIVLPFWHSGMEDVLPCTKPYIPRLGKKITVLFGEPINFNNIFEKFRREKRSEVDLRIAITEEVQKALYELKPKTEYLHQQR